MDALPDELFSWPNSFRTSGSRHHPCSAASWCLSNKRTLEEVPEIVVENVPRDYGGYELDRRYEILERAAFNAEYSWDLTEGNDMYCIAAVVPFFC